MNTPKFKDLIDFIIVNKQDKVFIDLNIPQIIFVVAEGIKNNTLYYSLTKEGLISGMILAKIDKEDKEIWIEENLSMNLSNLKEFAKKAKEQFGKEYKFAGFKHGKNRDYSSAFNRLTKE